MCWKAEYIILILFSTLIDYVVAIRISKTNIKSKKRNLLIISLFVNLGTLFLFKYFNFFSSNVNNILAQFNIFYDSSWYNLILPVGISFYTFQTLSYTIDVYYGKMPPEKDFFRFALYVSFFPQLVAGPIERATNLLPQFKKFHNPNYERITSGLRLMLWGFFKKVVIADRLAIYVNAVFNNINEYSGLPIIFAAIFFTIQIYTDFSGYSDIAIGAARIMGYNLMLNFKRPFFSRSIREFWSRWHISLSTWFRDYVYIPLGGNKVKKWRWYYNLLITFLLSGFWHGANWTFIIWGILNGLFLIFEILINLKQYKDTDKIKVNAAFRIVLTFILTILAFVIFRANNLNDAIYALTNMFNFKDGSVIGVPTISLSFFIQCIMAVVFLLTFELLCEIKQNIFKLKTFHIYAIVFIQIILIYVFGIFEEQEFIYFQF